MNFGQLWLCFIFGLIVYGAGFYRGLREGAKFQPPPGKPE